MRPVEASSPDISLALPSSPCSFHLLTEHVEACGEEGILRMGRALDHIHPLEDEAAAAEHVAKAVQHAAPCLDGGSGGGGAAGTMRSGSAWEEAGRPMCLDA